MRGSLTINTPVVNSSLEVPRICNGENNSVRDNNVASNNTSGREDRYYCSSPHLPTFIFVKITNLLCNQNYLSMKQIVITAAELYKLSAFDYYEIVSYNNGMLIVNVYIND